MLQHYALILATFELIIKFLKGHMNFIADSSFRLPININNTDEEKYFSYINLVIEVRIKIFSNLIIKETSKVIKLV